VTHHCDICHRQLQDDEDRAGRHACHKCTHQIRAWLAELTAQLPYLHASLRPDARPAQGHTGGRAHSPMPLRTDVVSLLGPGVVYGVIGDPHGDQHGPLPIHTWLYGWADWISREHPYVRHDERGTQWTTPCEAPSSSRGTDAAAWCHWLTAYLPHTATRPWAAEFHQQLDELLHQVRAITHLEPQRRLLAAPCPRCDSLALERTDWSDQIDCRTCGLDLTYEEYDTHLTRLTATHPATPRAPAPRPARQPNAAPPNTYHRRPAEATSNTYQETQ
jgi:hypothetical protein